MDPLAAVNAGWADTPASPSSSPTSPTARASQSSAPHSPTAAGRGAAHHPHSSTLIREPHVYGDPGTSLMHPGPPGTATAAGGTNSNEQPQPAAPFLRVRIGVLERNRKDLLIRYDASTNLPNFRTSLYRNMQRSYVEFQRFAEQVKLCCPQTIIPALPLPHTSSATDEEDDRLVRINLQRWFSRVCDNPVLQKEDELRSFIESDFGYQPVPPPSSRRQSQSAGASFTAALSKMVRRGPMDDDDEIEGAKVTLEKLEPAWQAAANAVGNMGKVRKAVATANTEVGGRLIALATDESDAALATGERKMGRVYEQLASMSGAQSASDNVILNDSLAYQASNAKSARDALAQRAVVLEDSHNATKAAINKRRVVERLKSSSSINPSKVDEAITDMDEANALETQLTSRIDAISQNLHIALRAHSRSAHEDVAASLLEHARMSIIFSRQTLRELEALRPDVVRVTGAAGSPLAQQVPQQGSGKAVAGVPQAPAPYASPYAGTAGYNNPAQQAQAAQHQSPAQAHAPTPGFAPQTPTGALRAPAPGMTQSMFLPGQRGPSSTGVTSPGAGGPLGGPQVQRGSAPGSGAASAARPGTPGTPTKPGVGAGAVDPLGGAPMAQSMMLPGRAGTPQRRRLDERKAAKLLAGGF